jgi:hypothetical protein
MHGTCTKVISVAGREFRTTDTMGDIFLAHVADIISRADTQLVPLLHEGGVEMLFVGPNSEISVRRISVASAEVPEIGQASGTVAESSAA